MLFSCAGEGFFFFSCVRARMNVFRSPRPLGASAVRIGNGVGKQGCGNKSSDCSASTDSPRQRKKRKADTEFQYRPRIVDTDIDCGPRFCGPRFRDSYRFSESRGLSSKALALLSTSGRATTTTQKRHLM